jgi:cobalt-zinc-cadmium efflux system outer membrane protein
MLKNIVLTLCASVLTFCSFSQANSIDNLLFQIEKNNIELKALAHLQKVSQLEIKSSNQLPDPEIGGYYMPAGNHTGAKYTEFQISQRLEFPTVYGVRSNLINQQFEQSKLEFEEKRQEILFRAKALCFNLIYLNKRLNIESLRLKQAELVYEQTKQLFEKGEAGILELNKSKVAWMQDQFKVQEIQNEGRRNLTFLIELNGNREAVLTASNFRLEEPLIELDSLWSEKLERDPELLQLKQKEVLSQQSLKLAKHQSLPNITAGYNSQGIMGERYAGVYAGVTIPLWRNRTKLKSAHQQIIFQEKSTLSQTLHIYSEYESKYNEYHLLSAKFQEYQSTLSTLSSDDLLLQAYQLGEFSFMEYYIELQFYRQAFDSMLSMEHQLQLLKAELLKHQL